jgi:glucokinase
MSHRLGIDLGGTSAKIVLVNSQHKIVSDATVATNGFPDAKKLAKKIADVCRLFAEKNNVSRVGVGVAGDVDFERGVIRISPNLGWKNVPLKKLLESHLKLPVSVDNDAKAAAWGLYKTQIPEEIKHAIVVTLGTGVGGGIIVNGAIHRGATNTAGEIGHMIIHKDGPLCNCGMHGCLETYVGGPHLIKKAGPKYPSVLALAQAANAGDRRAQSIWSDAGRALGLAFGDLIYILNPQMIVLTGGISQAGDLLLKPIWKTLNQRTFKTPLAAVKIIVADKAPHIGAIGASLL